jgi:tripartite-type tricarboxylate transporter receptor subunit TctC
MLTSRFAAGFVLLGLSGLVVGVACGQDYPRKPIRIVTSNIGSGNDFVARIVAQGLTDSLGQQVVVDNRPAGPMSGELVSKAPADGYTLLVGSSSLWTGPLLQKTPYDAVRDFAPITLMSRVPNIVVVYPGVPVNSIKDLVALAKAKPGELNYASGSTGGGSHLAVELFKSMAGVNIVRVVYKGGSQQIIDLMGGRVQMTIDDAPTLMPNVRSGKLKALAITSAQPSALYPELATVSASGVPGYESGGMQGMFGPAKTSDALVKRLNQEIVRLLRTAEVRGKLVTLGYETVGNSQEEFAALIKSEIAKVGKVIKDAGITAE